MIGKPTPGILLRRDSKVRFGPLLVLRVQVAEEGDAPAASGARAETLADERGYRRLFPFEIASDFPEGNMEAEADLVVGMHEGW